MRRVCVQTGEETADSAPKFASILSVTRKQIGPTREKKAFNFSEFRTDRDRAMSKSKPSEELAVQLKAWKLPPFVVEHRFHSVRKWRFDVAWPEYKVACEVDVGGFVAGRHSRGLGIEKDCEKVNEAAILGWRVLRVTPRHVRDGSALSWLERMFFKD